jgi:hypothetical protein
LLKSITPTSSLTRSKNQSGFVDNGGAVLGNRVAALRRLPFDDGR